MKKFILYTHWCFVEAWPAAQSKAHMAREMIELTFTELEDHGRPDVYGKAGFELPCWLPDDVYERLKAHAVECGVAMSSLVRACTRRAMLREGVV